MSERKPIHESIIPAINAASVNTCEELLLLGKLIQATKFPANHDAILDAWKTRVAVYISGDRDHTEADVYSRGVVRSLLDQKKEAENTGKVKEKKEPETTKPKITIECFVADLDPSVNLFHVDVERDGGVWSETLPTEDAVHWFCRGLSAAYAPGYLGLMPEIPRSYAATPRLILEKPKQTNSDSE